MDFKELLNEVSHQSKMYNFCSDGKRGLQNADNIQNLIKMLRDTIFWCFDTEYSQAVVACVEKWYANWKEQFNLGGIWVNEETERRDAIIIITKKSFGTDCYHFQDNQRVFVFHTDDKEIIHIECNDHAHLYCKHPYANITLRNSSHGFTFAGTVMMNDSAICYAEDTVFLRGYGRRIVCTENCEYIDDNGECHPIKVTTLGLAGDIKIVGGIGIQ